MSTDTSRTGLIREATALDAAAIAQVHVASWRSTYCGIIDDAYLARLSVEAHARGWSSWFATHPKPGFLRVVVDDSAKIVGFAMAGSVRGATTPADGEVQVLYLLAAHQRAGLGGALLRSMARGLQQRGMTAVVIRVLQRNPACAFYARMGGHRTESRFTRVGSQRLAEVTYRWGDIDALIAAPSGKTSDGNTLGPSTRDP